MNINVRDSYDSFPYYEDLYFCEKCGSPLKDDIKLINLKLEKNYERKIERKCKKCGYSYNFISKIFTGADGEKYIGKFVPGGEIITSSGVLTKNGEWDSERIKKENLAKNFKLKIAINKEKQRDDECG